MDAELSVDQSKLNKEKLSNRYENLKRSFPNLYEDLHYSLATKVFDKMNKFSNLFIYSFQ
jgi:hypothetical protein